MLAIGNLCIVRCRFIVWGLPNAVPTIGICRAFVLFGPRCPVFPGYWRKFRRFFGSFGLPLLSSENRCYVFRNMYGWLRSINARKEFSPSKHRKDLLLSPSCANRCDCSHPICALRFIPSKKLWPSSLVVVTFHISLFRLDIPRDSTHSSSPCFRKPQSFWRVVRRKLSPCGPWLPSKNRSPNTDATCLPAR